MISGTVVFYKIATTGLLILVGFIVRRMKLLPDFSIGVLSKFNLYLALPCYVIFYLPNSVSRETAGEYWFFPLLGMGLVGLSDLFGFGCAKLMAGRGEFATFRLIVCLPNWMFMGLAVCEPLFREDGVRVLLLYNIGIIFYLWTFGMTSFRAGEGWRRVLYNLFVNVQTAALAIGLILAFFCPFLRGMELLDYEELAALPLHIGIISPFWETVRVLGQCALPLTIVQIGLLLGAPTSESGPATATERRSLVLTGVLRLVASPILTIAALVLACRLGLPLTRPEFLTSAIMMSMPAAVVILTITDIYNGANRLAAKAILWQSVASLATAPLLTGLAQMAYELI